jgi:hypothetical protein
MLHEMTEDREGLATQMDLVAVLPKAFVVEIESERRKYQQDGPAQSGWPRYSDTRRCSTPNRDREMPASREYPRTRVLG